MVSGLVNSAMSATIPLTHQLLPIWCSAAKRRDVPIGDILPFRITPAATTSMALTCRWRSRPQHQKRSKAPGAVFVCFRR